MAEAHAGGKGGVIGGTGSKGRANVGALKKGEPNRGGSPRGGVSAGKDRTGGVNKGEKAGSKRRFYTNNSNSTYTLAKRKSEAIARTEKERTYKKAQKEAAREEARASKLTGTKDGQHAEVIDLDAVLSSPFKPRPQRGRDMDDGSGEGATPERKERMTVKELRAQLKADREEAKAMKEKVRKENRESRSRLNRKLSRTTGAGQFKLGALSEHLLKKLRQT